MRLLTALLLGLTTTTFAQTTPDHRNVNFSLSQATSSISLDQNEYETIYRTDQVPDTCYRSEVQGTRTECHTEYDRQCHTTYENVCRTESYPVCTTVPRRECSTTQQCHNEPSQVCNSHGCTTINRRVCNPVQSCHTTSDRVCHTDHRTVCNNEPRQSCQNVPRNVCVQVPNVVQVPYSCMRPVQVPIGQQLKLHTTAQVAINLVNFAETGAIQDVLTASLSNGQVSIAALNENTNTHLFYVLNQQRTEQVNSPTEKVVTYTISIAATSIQKLNALQNSQINNGKLFYDRLDFNLIGSLDVPLKGHLKIVQYRRRSGIIMIDDDFTSSGVTSANGLQSIAFKQFGVDSLNGATHLVELSLALDMNFLKKGLLNSGALVQIQNKAVLSSFEAYPAE